MALDARLAYIENEILQADPIRLVQLLYRGAIDAVGKAQIHVGARDIAGRSSQITKAAEILNELTLSLDREQGGEVAANLVELYDYMQRRLQDANFEQIAAPLAEVERLLTTLLEAWEQCGPAPQPAASPARKKAEPPPVAPPPAAYDEIVTSYGPRRAVGY